MKVETGQPEQYLDSAQHPATNREQALATSRQSWATLESVFSKLLLWWNPGNKQRPASVVDSCPLAGPPTSTPNHRTCQKRGSRKAPISRKQRARERHQKACGEIGAGTYAMSRPEKLSSVEADRHRHASEQLWTHQDSPASWSRATGLASVASHTTQWWMLDTFLLGTWLAVLWLSSSSSHCDK